MSEPALIEIECLNFSYNGQPVLEDVCLEIGDREFVSVVGPNGGGKTTLLRLILGLLQPTSGRITVLGTSPERARQEIGYLAQHNPADPLFPVNVMDVVLMGRLSRKRLFGPYHADDKAAAREMLGKVGLAEFHQRPFSSLSGGQRQRVLIARSLVSRPRLLLLDEPTASLDMTIEKELYELLRELSRTLTVMVVSHDLGFVSQYVQKVVCVKRGVVVHPTSELTGEVIKQVFGDVRMIQHDNHCRLARGHHD